MPTECAECGAVYPRNKRAVKGTGDTKSAGEYALSITCSARGRKNRCKSMRCLVSKSKLYEDDFNKLVQGESTDEHINESVADDDLYTC